MTRHPLMRLSTLLGALAVPLLVGLVVTLTRADDPAAAAGQRRRHPQGTYRVGLRHRLHARRQVRRHRQLRQDRQGLGNGHRQGVQDASAARNGHTALVLSVAVSPDGTLVASGGVGQHRQNLGLPDGQFPARFRHDRRRQRRRPQPRRQDRRRRRQGRPRQALERRRRQGAVLPRPATPAPSSASPSAPTASCSSPAAPTRRSASGTRPTVRPSP